MDICPHCNKQLSANGHCGSCGRNAAEGGGASTFTSASSVASDSGHVSVAVQQRATPSSLSEQATNDSCVTWSMDTIMTRECDLPAPMRTILVEDCTIRVDDDDRIVFEGDWENSSLDPGSSQIADGHAGREKQVQSSGDDTHDLTDGSTAEADPAVQQDGLDAPVVTGTRTLVTPSIPDSDLSLAKNDDVRPHAAVDHTLVEDSVADSDHTFVMDDDTPSHTGVDRTLVEDSIDNSDRTIVMADDESSHASGDHTLVENSIDDSDHTIAMDNGDPAVAPGDRTLVEDTVATSSSARPQGAVTNQATRSPGRNSGRADSFANPNESLFNIQQRLLASPGKAFTDPEMRADYEIIKALGKGGMGEVWLAKQTSLNREVALKQIRMDHRASSSMQKMQSARYGFLAEAVVTGELNHPNIIPVYDIGKDVEGHLLYSMKVVSGTSWDRSIKSTSESDNIEILRKVADAIGFAHSRGVVHRDLKPANIMVGSYGEVLVMDWGTALPLENFSKGSEVRSSIGCAGTPAYMPPEQAEGVIEKIGPHSDIYLLGAILFEIVTGAPPHPQRKPTGESLTTRELLKNAYQNVIIETTESGELLDIALKALQRSPADRYAKVDSFIDALKSYQKHAESVMLVKQARADLDAAKATNDYSMYARALYGFENALNLWDANQQASQGLIDTRLDYANAALNKEDYDLGLSLVSGDHADFVSIHKQLLLGQQERSKRVARLRTAQRLLAVSLTAAFLIVAVAALWINREREKAVLAAEQELKARQLAVDAQEVATKERDNAVLAAEQELKAKQLAVSAQKEATQERDNAVKAAAAEKLAKNEAVSEWYYSQINLADQMITQNAFDSAREILGKIDSRLQEGLLDNDDSKLAREIGWEFQRLKYVCGLGDNKLGASNAGDSIQLTAVAAGEKVLATANARGDVELWDCGAAGKHIRTLATGGRPISMAMTPDGETIALGDISGVITTWNVTTGLLREELGRHEREVTQLMYLPEGPLISTSRDKTARIWNVHDKTFVAMKGHSDGILSLARVANQQGGTIGLLTGDSNRGEILYWKWPAGDAPKGLKVASNEKTGFTALAAQRRGETLIVYAGTEDGTLKAISFPEPTNSQRDSTIATKIHSLIRQPSDRHHGTITKLMIDPVDQNRLISTSQDNTIRTWNISLTALFNPSDPEERQVLLQRTLRGHGNAIVDGVAWKDKESGVTRLLTGSTDGTARLWRPDVFPDIVTFGGTTLKREASAFGEIVSVSVGGPQSDRIMAVSNDGNSNVWNVPGNPAKSSKTLRISLNDGHRFLTQSAVQLKDVLVTISFDGTAAVWDTGHSKSMVARLPNVGTTGVLAGSPDGRWVITGYAPAEKTSDENLQVWSLTNGLHGPVSATNNTATAVGTTLKAGKPFQPRDTPKPVPDLPSAAAVSPSGNWGIVGSENGYLNLIDLAAHPIVVTAPVEAHASSQDSDNPTPEGVTGVAFLSEFEAASVGLDGNLRFWTIQSGKLIPNRSLTTYAHVDGKVVHRVIGMAVSENGHRIATRLRTGKSTVSAQNPNFDQIWILDLENGGVKPFAKLQSLGTDDDSVSKVESLSLSSNGQRILATVAPVAKTQINQTQHILREWTLSAGSDSPSRDVLKSSPGLLFQQASYAAGDSDRIIILSDTATTIRSRTDQGDFSHAPESFFGPTVSLQACDISDDGSLAITASDLVIPGTDRNVGNESVPAQLKGEIRFWKLQDLGGERIGRVTVDGAIHTVAISPGTSNRILVAGNLRSPTVPDRYAAMLFDWNGTDLVPAQSLGNHRLGIVCARFSPDGRRIVTASSDGQAEVFEVDGNNFKSLNVLNLTSTDRRSALRGLINADLNHDGSLLVAADKSSALVIHVKTGEATIEPPIQGHSGDLTGVRFALRSNLKAPERLWTTSRDGTVKFWGIEATADTQEKKLKAARLLLTLRGHESAVLSLAALPNGGVVTGGEDGQVILWPVGPASDLRAGK